MGWLTEGLVKEQEAPKGSSHSLYRTSLRGGIRRPCTVLLMLSLMQCMFFHLCYSDVKVNVENDMIYPIGYPIALEVNGNSDKCVKVLLNKNAVDAYNFPYYLYKPGFYTLEIYTGSSTLTLSFEVVDYIPLVAEATAYVVQGSETGAKTIVVSVPNFKLDPRYALQYTLPMVAIPCEAIVTPSLTLYSLDSEAEYRATRVKTFGDSILAEFEISAHEIIENLFTIGTILINGERAVFETTNLDFEPGRNSPESGYTMVPYCPPSGGCTPRCTWKSKVTTHDKTKLNCTMGNSLHGAEVKGESAGNTMWGEGWAIDTVPLLASFCADAGMGTYRRLIYHYVENPNCPCPGRQSIDANMNPRFTACSLRGGLSVFYWMSYAKAGGWMSVSATGLGSAEAKGGVHIGGSNQISFGNSGITITLVPAPPGGCSPFADNKSYSAGISRTLVTCSSGIGIEVYAEGAMGGLVTLFAEAKASIKDASCNTQLILSCPCCGGGIVTIR